MLSFFSVLILEPEDRGAEIMRKIIEYYTNKKKKYITSN